MARQSMHNDGMATTKKRTPNQTLAHIRAQPQLLTRAKVELRDRIRNQAERAVDLLVAAVDGKVDPTPMRVKAAQILLAKVLPDLSSSDVTVHDPHAGKTAEELLDMLKAAVAGLDAAAREQILHLTH